MGHLSVCPLFRSLHNILNDNTVIEQIDECPRRIHTNELIEDFCDGSLIAKHLCFTNCSLL